MKPKTPLSNHSLFHYTENNSDVGYMDSEWIEEIKNEDVENTK